MAKNDKKTDEGATGDAGETQPDAPTVSTEQSVDVQVTAILKGPEDETITCVVTELGTVSVKGQDFGPNQRVTMTRKEALARNKHGVYLRQVRK